MSTPGASGGKRPVLASVPDEIRHLGAKLAQELLGWPDVRERRMFGMRAFYRGDVIFAMIPDKWALQSSRTVAYKLPAGGATMESEKWLYLELESERSIEAALATLDNAYLKAKR